MRAGPRNLITDVPGILVGNSEDARVRTGTTVVLAHAPVVAAIDQRGGAPGTRETDLLRPENAVQQVDAVVLTGGSAFGLDAAGAVTAALAARGRGFTVRGIHVPIVPAAVLFDLANGGEKDWEETPPYAALGRSALQAAGSTFTLGRAGAGFGATTADGPGGLGSASEVLDHGIIVGALVAANPLGSPLIGGGPHFWAAPFEHDGEFGGHGLPQAWGQAALQTWLKGQAGENTTLAVVATNAALTRVQAKRVAVMAQTGLARAIYPVHTPLDGDTVFVLATGDIEMDDPLADLTRLGTAAANCLARAVARGVFEALRAG